MTGNVIYQNLPAEVEVNIYHYKMEERWDNFRDVMMCLLTLHATMNGTIQQSPEPDELMTNSVES